ncbi:GNAT family N-acetyltransferase [Salimicrobium jeotgali]|nr:GNAT family protein [Salimicrobium jeotgali]
MTEESAIRTLKWKYREPYDFYNCIFNEKEINERLDGSYKVVVDEYSEEVFGFFCLGESARIPAGHQHGVYDEECVDLGVGMKPEKTGKGHGFKFMSFIVEYIREHYGKVCIRLSVAVFNERAIRLYKNSGFELRSSFLTDTSSFITMVRE